jgi:hypothetical protein
LVNIEGMESRQIELVFNLIAITAITSLALFCVLLKRDKDKLTAELILWRNELRTRSSLQSLQDESQRDDSPAAAPDTHPAAHQDIRQFVARRVQGWITRS